MIQQRPWIIAFGIYWDPLRSVSGYWLAPLPPSQELADSHGSNKLLCTTKLDKMLMSSANKRRGGTNRQIHYAER